MCYCEHVVIINNVLIITHFHQESKALCFSIDNPYALNRYIELKVNESIEGKIQSILSQLIDNTVRISPRKIEGICVVCIIRQ